MISWKIDKVKKRERELSAKSIKGAKHSLRKMKEVTERKKSDEWSGNLSDGLYKIEDTFIFGYTQKQRATRTEYDFLDFITIFGYSIRKPTRSSELKQMLLERKDPHMGKKYLQVWQKHNIFTVSMWIYIIMYLTYMKLKYFSIR